MNESVENPGNVEFDLTEQPVNPPGNAEESYKRLEERLAVIPEDEIVSPKQPLHVISTEATEVAIAAVEDRETLIGYGADESMIEGGVHRFETGLRMGIFFPAIMGNYIPGSTGKWTSQAGWLNPRVPISRSSGLIFPLLGMVCFTW